MWLNKLSDKQSQFLVKQLIKGDGSYTSTLSSQLWGRKEILEKWLGFCVTHNIDANLAQDIRGHYYLCIHKQEINGIGIRQIYPKDLKIKPYNDLMWDVEVKNHIIFIEKNGKPLITGNSNNSLKTLNHRLIIKFGGIYIGMTHRPEDVIVEDEKHYYPLNLVGHVHNAWVTKEIKNKEGKISLLLNVSCDVHKFRPINFDEIKAIFDKLLSNHPKRKEINKCLVTKVK
jgi:hypothetical protein